jgi:hypothetical protein
MTYRLAVVRGSELRVRLRHLSKTGLTVSVYETHWNFANIQIQNNLVGTSGAPQDERGPGKIHLTRKGLHFLLTESATVKKNRKRVALERLRAEHIDLHHLQASHV